MARVMLAELSASKLSVSAFARLHEIPKQRVFYWLERLSDSDGKEGHHVGGSGFAPIKVKANPVVECSPPRSQAAVPVQTLETTLANGSRVVVHGQWDASSMRFWLAAIEGERC